MNRKNFLLIWVEHERSFITLGPEWSRIVNQMMFIFKLRIFFVDSALQKLGSLTIYVKQVPTGNKAENHVTYFDYSYLYSDRTGKKNVQYFLNTQRIFMRLSASTLSL